MPLARVLKHLFAWPHSFLRAWSQPTLDQVQAAITASEKTHRAQLRFCVEESLPLSYLRRNASARERAITLFGKLRVWDTEENIGVLIYVLHCERKVELVADRGVARTIDQDQWNSWVRQLQTAYQAGEFAQGSCACISDMSQTLAKHFPQQGNYLNELTDEATVIRR